MLRSNILRVIFIVGLFTYSYPSVSAEPISFNVKPKKCVSLHEGQVCYQRIKFSWVSPAEGVLCLHSTGDDTPIHCSRNAGLMTYYLEFKSSEKQEFELREKNGSIVSMQFIDVVSVYKGKRRATTGWRLF